MLEFTLNTFEKNRKNDIRKPYYQHIKKYELFWLNIYHSFTPSETYYFNVKNIFNDDTKSIESALWNNKIDFREDYRKFGDWIDDLWTPPYDVEKELIDKCLTICNTYTKKIYCKLFIKEFNFIPNDLIELIFSFIYI